MEIHDYMASIRARYKNMVKPLLGSSNDVAIKALGEGGREMYEVCLNQGHHELSIKRSIHLSGDKNPGGSIGIHRNVLDALLGNFTPVVRVEHSNPSGEYPMDLSGGKPPEPSQAEIDTFQ